MLWKGQLLTNYKEVFGVLKQIDTQEEADHLMELASEAYGPSSKVVLFRIASYIDSIERLTRVLGLLFKLDFNEPFFVVEGPVDEFGNTGMVPSVIKVQIVVDDGFLDFKILGPTELTRKGSLLPHVFNYNIVEGPARMLDRDEWAQLVGFKRE